MNMKINPLKLLREKVLSSDGEEFFKSLCAYFDYVKKQKWGKLALEKIKKIYLSTLEKELPDFSIYLIAIEEICKVFKIPKKELEKNFYKASQKKKRNKDEILLKGFLKVNLEEILEKHKNFKIKGLKPPEEIKFEFPFVDRNANKIYFLPISIERLKKYFSKIHKLILSFQSDSQNTLVFSDRQIKKLLKLKTALSFGEKFSTNNIIRALITKAEKRDYPIALYEDEIKGILKSHVYIEDPIALSNRLKGIIREANRKLRKKGINFAKVKLIHTKQGAKIILTINIK